MNSGWSLKLKNVTICINTNNFWSLQVPDNQLQTNEMDYWELIYFTKILEVIEDQQIIDFSI
jgi:hypothetical protein